MRRIISIQIAVLLGGFTVAGLIGCGPKVRTETKTVAQTVKTVTHTNTTTHTMPANTVSVAGTVRTVMTPPPPPPAKVALPPGVIKIDVSHFLVDPAFKSSIGLICTRGDTTHDANGETVHRPPGLHDLGTRGAYFYVACNANQKQY